MPKSAPERASRPISAIKTPVAADINAIFDAPYEAEAKQLTERLTQPDEDSAPALTEWAETALPEGLAVPGATAPASIPAAHVQHHRGRQARDPTTYPRGHAVRNEASCLRLVTAELINLPCRHKSQRDASHAAY